MPLNRMRFMNTYVDNVTEEEAIRHIEECVKNRTIGFVVTPNVDQIVMMEKNLYFREICDNAELSVVDGHPLLWIAKWYKRPIKEKICGSDLMPHLCKIAAEKGYKVFLLGQEKLLVCFLIAHLSRNNFIQLVRGENNLY